MLKEFVSFAQEFGKPKVLILILMEHAQRVTAQLEQVDIESMS